MGRRLRLLALVPAAWLAPLAACADLPDEARPTARVVTGGSYAPGDTIRYRALSRGDFQASAPPAHIAGHAANFGAFACIHIVPGAFEAQPRLVPGRGSAGYVASLPEVVFHAEMDRSCSWWNPDPRDFPAAYILQHEQIHFALAELQARRLTAASRRLEARGSSPASAASALERAIADALHRARKEFLKRNTAFDEETSGGHNPGGQADWFERVMAELAGES